MLDILQIVWDRLTGGGRRPVGFVVATKTDRGLVRADNQDAFVVQPGAGLFAVADGMGGGEGGALASRWTCEALARAWTADPAASLKVREPRVVEALQDANERIRAHAREQGYKLMGTTVAAFLQDPASGGFVGRVLHIGDSRVYRYRHGRLDALTRDHTVGNELGTAMSSVNAEQAESLRARSNPLTHVLTRAVGVEQRVRPEWKTIDVQRGDRLLLCSDGVHDMLSDAEIAAVLREALTPRLAVARLEAAVRKAGAGDNYTLVCAYAVARHASRNL